nr:GMC family oxidoreductase N-terminal domain-containing protein [Candidatus Methanofastidiosa archaeon]
MENEFDYIIIGSGAGGAPLARELSKVSQSILIMEKGIMETEIGGKKNFSRYADIVKSLEGINIMRAIMAGGTTTISAGCSMRCLEDELVDLGIDLSEEFRAAERDIGNRPIPKRLLSNRSKAILEAARSVGRRMELMPKCYTEECDGCGLCMTGCGRNCKWTAIDDLKCAQSNGAVVCYGADAKYVEKRKNGLLEVHATVDGVDKFFMGRKVIVCAGALETPRILIRSGIENAGTNLSVDLLRHIYCFVPEARFCIEPPMSIVSTEFYDEKGYILASNINISVVEKYIESQGGDFPYRVENALGIMVKIKDCPNGRVFADGTVSKDVDTCDLMKFNDAFEVVKDMFIGAGADPGHIFESHINGAH